MTDLRLPLGCELRSELEVKRSRFITLIRRVDSADVARQLLADARDEFPDARHHCSAFIVSQQHANPVLHSSDDGEPSGTAGRPMLDVLVGHNLTDISAVVVRYFGGTLLGTGGLVRAYSDAVRECLSGAPVVEQVQLTRQRILLDHASAGKTEADLRARGYEVMDVDYQATGVVVDLAIADAPSFALELAELTAGQVTPEHAGAIIHERPYGNL